MRNNFYLVAFLVVLLFSCKKGENSQEVIGEIENQDSLNYLNEFIGKKPVAVDLWDTEPLQSALKKALGDQYDTFLVNVSAAQELERDRVIYTIAPLSDSLTNIHGYTVALFDTAANKVEIFFLQHKEATQYPAEGETLYLPDKVRNLMYQYLSWQVYEGILPCADCEGIKTELALEPSHDHPGSRYFLQQTYLGKPEKEEPLQQEGTYLQVHENASASSDTIYQIKKEQPEVTLYFLKTGEDKLELLDSEQHRIRAKDNLTLEKKNLAKAPPTESKVNSLLK